MSKITAFAYNNIEVNDVFSTTINNARQNFDNLVSMALNNNEVINVVTDNGNIIMLSEDDYRDILLTLEVCANPDFKRSLHEAAESDDFVDESEVEW